MPSLPPAFVVTLDPVRLAQFRKAWEAVGLPPDAVREWRGCWLDGEWSLGNAVAQYALARHAVATGLDALLVFEDDAVPCDTAACDLPREIEAARARGDAALRLGWLPDGDEDDADGATLLGSHAYALLSPRAIEDYCAAWERHGKADYVFGFMDGRVGRTARCLFAQHGPAGSHGVHFPRGWSRIYSRRDLKAQHAAFVKSAAAIGAEPPVFSGEEAAK